MYSNFNGTKLIIIDNNSQAYLFLSREESIKPIENWPKNCKSVMWDSQDLNLFVVIKEDKLCPFIIINNIEGIFAKPVYEYLSIDQANPNISETLIDRAIKPIQLINGNLYFMTQTGTLQSQFLHSHSHLDGWNTYVDQEYHLRFFL